MPRYIAKRPASDDPRDWRWLPDGWLNGYIPPIKWLLQSADAPHPYQVFRNGIILPLTLELPGQATYYVDVPIFTYPSLDLTIFSHQPGPPAPGFPNGVTVQFIFLAFEGLFTSSGGGAAFYFPDPYVDVTFPVTGISGGAPDWPEPMIITPMPFWTPDGNWPPP